MRDIAVVAFSQRQEAMINTESEVEFMVPLMNEAKDAVGLTQQEMGFTCSGSSDFLAGQAFSFVMTIDGTGRATGDRWRYESTRRWPRRHTGDGELPAHRSEARIGATIDPDDVSPFEHFLTARWGLFSRFPSMESRRAVTLYAPVDHEIGGKECLHRFGRIGEVDEKEVEPPHAHDLEADALGGQRRVGVPHDPSLSGPEPLR